MTGRVREVGYDPVLYGNYLLIHGEGEHRSYFYAHMRRPPSVHAASGSAPASGSAIVGKTGNARTVGCQLHFEIHVDGRPIDPEPDAAALGPLQLTAFEPEVWLSGCRCSRGPRGSRAAR